LKSQRISGLEALRKVTIGATAAEGGTRAKSITLGGQTTLPYLQFEAPTPNTSGRGDRDQIAET
jgi:CO dehydrogenase/acetyl-CoA synthase delta subunit